MTSKELEDTGLVQKFTSEALESNNTLEQKWKQYKNEYEELKTCLEEFPKELSASIMMPLGSKVFVRAQLCNTNEVFIRYDDIFTKQTAHEAKTVCERHIKRCNGMIENLTREKKLLSDNMYARQEIISEPTDEIKEIIEPYDEEKELAWKEVHKQKVKEYKQQLLDNKNNQSIEDCRKVIDEFKKAGLENKLAGAYKKSTYFDSFEIHCGRNPKDFTNGSDDCSSSESSDDEDMDDDDDEDEDDVDDEEDEDSKLEIVFSNDVPETTRNLRKKMKKKVSFNNDVQIKEFEPRPEEHFIRRREENEKPNILVTEIDDIVERIPNTCLENKSDDDEETAKPVSRFKANRKKSNNG